MVQLLANTPVWSARLEHTHPMPTPMCAETVQQVCYFGHCCTSALSRCLAHMTAQLVCVHIHGGGGNVRLNMSPSDVRKKLLSPCQPSELLVLTACDTTACMSEDV